MLLNHPQPDSKAMSSGTKFNGVTLTTSATTKARRREAPFLHRALTATSRDEAMRALNQGRNAIESSRETALETTRKKR